MTTRIFVVSLDTAGERRRTFVARAAGTTLPWRFFDAHRTLLPELAYDPAVALAHHGRVLERAELGCYASHYALWRQLLTDDADQYIILEDDLIVDWRMIERIAEHDFAAHDHHYVRLYYKRPSRFMTLHIGYIARNLSLIRLFDVVYGTQGYVVTRDAARRLIAACREVRRPIDDQMDRYWEHGVPNLSLFPFPIIEEAVASGIDGERPRPKRRRGSPADRVRAYSDRTRRNWIMRRALGGQLARRVARKLGHVLKRE